MPYKLHAPEKIAETVIDLSSSKSISNRALIIQHLSKSNSSIHRLSTAKDTVLLNQALQNIKLNKNASIDVGHAGTSMRFLTALLALTPGNWTLTGSERMKNRPIGVLVESLKKLGASISYIEKEGFPPLTIEGSFITGGEIVMDASVSSQYVSSLMLVAPYFKNGLVIKFTSKPISFSYIRMTASIMEHFGISSDLSEQDIRIPSGNYLEKEFTVESDWSSASYWFSICALSKNASFILKGLHKDSLQGDAIVTELFKELGVQVEFKNDSCVLRKSDLPISSFFRYDFSNCPDIAQTVAVCCAALKIPFELSGLQTLNLKESRRIETLISELKKIGIGDFSFSSSHLTCRSYPEKFNSSVSIDTFDDHRMAMAFTAFSLRIPNLSIENPDVVVKSYPEFWDHLKKSGFSVL